MPATASSSPSSSSQPATMADYDPREDSAWIYSFGAAMVPFCGFLYIHKLGMTARVVEATVRSPIGVYGLFLLPFCTLAMEKSIYDTVQSWQGINPQVRPADRGGFPSGGAGVYICVCVHVVIIIQSTLLITLFILIWCACCYSYD